MEAKVKPRDIALQIIEDPCIQTNYSFTEADIPSPGILLSNSENEFLEAVRRNDKEYVSDHLVFNSSHIDVNCVDINGETALEIAVENENTRMVHLLVQHGADLRKAVLQAVQHGSCNAVKKLMSLLQESDSCKKSTQQYAYYVTPLMLAAQLEHYDIIRVLLLMKETIPKPHSYYCSCELCNRDERGLLRSLRRFNTYKALANPVYISLDYIVNGGLEPVERTFKMIKKLREEMDLDVELVNEYKQIIAECDTFAEELLGACTYIKETACVMDLQLDNITKQITGEESYPRMLEMALSGGHPKFVAHPNSQHLLNSIIYRNLPTKLTWRKRNPLMKLLMFFCLYISLPVLVFVYHLCPNHQYSQILRSPFVKLVNHWGSFIIFLLLLTAVSFQNLYTQVDKIDPVGILCAVWFVGIVVQECNQARVQGKSRYIYGRNDVKAWRLVTLLMIILFSSSYIIWITGYVIMTYVHTPPTADSQGIQTGHALMMISNCVFSFGIVFAFVNMSNVLQFSAVVGPMQLSLYRIVKDVMKFLFIFVFVLMAFGISLKNLYSYYSFKMLAGPEDNQNLDSTETNHHDLAFIKTTFVTLFWSIFDKTETDVFKVKNKNFRLIETTGELLFALYEVIAVLIALNMLIAMMAITFQKVVDNEDVQWKFGRARMWMEWVVKGSVLPPPFNLIPNPKAICRCINKDGPSCYRKGSDGTDMEYGTSITDRKKRKIMKRLIQRYFYKKLEKDRQQAASIEDIVAVKKEILQSFSELVGKTIHKPLSGDYSGTVTPRRKKEIESGVEELKELDEAYWLTDESDNNNMRQDTSKSQFLEPILEKVEVVVKECARNDDLPSSSLDKKNNDETSC